jgi:hypothetical protein
VRSDGCGGAEPSSIFGCGSGVGTFVGVRRGERDKGSVVCWTDPGTGPGEGVGSGTGGVGCVDGGVGGLIGGVDAAGTVCKGGTDAE